MYAKPQHGLDRALAGPQLGLSSLGSACWVASASLRILESTAARAC
jgi:hypothetical protein